MTYDFLKTLYDDLVSIIQGLVVKRTDLARENETIESLRSFETYLACVNGTRYFSTFEKYDLDLLETFFDPDTAFRCHKDPQLIPERLRDRIVKDQADRIIANYVEKNEYYRMLMGLPRLDDHYWIYVRDQRDIPKDVPVHELTIEQISRLEIRGILAKLQKDFPDKDYLHYLGINSIDLIDARLARPFDILRMGSASNQRSIEMFQESYYIARHYTLATVYHREEFTAKKIYDPIVGILMLTLAVRNTMVPSEKDYLNFEEILDAILESYGFLKYFKKFPFTYKRRLVIAMDQLLKVKGTDGVLVDVCKLFSPDNDLIANRYYLMKTHTKDVDGNIIFSGDPNQDYTLQFVRAAISDCDISMQEEDRLAYSTVTDADYLWQITPDEKTKLLEKDFNLMFTKYVDVEAAYDITSLVFEVCCFINLLLYARDYLSKVSIQNVYATGGKCSLFTMLNFLLAAMSKRAHFDGNIIYEPADIAEIWRFNYGDIEDRIKEVVAKYELRIDVDDVLLTGFDMKLERPNGVMNPSSILNVYAQNRALFDAIVEEMNKTTDIDQYIALANCKDILFTSATERQTFMKADGEIASTYEEMLEDLEPRLKRKLDTLEDDDSLNALIIYIFERLEEMFNSNELHYLFLNTPTVYATLIGKYIRIAINVFKSAPTQLRSINVFFYLGDRDPIRVIDGKVVHRKEAIDEWVHVKDELSSHKTIILDEYVSVGDKVYVNIE
ncbi:MAG: hypothetical protein NC311_05580 [Muribaculaceae bacterium]|nr:hypothetical protein [Muribaculaceae bacterium]